MQAPMQRTAPAVAAAAQEAASSKPWMPSECLLVPVKHFLSSLQAVHTAVHNVFG